MKVRSYRLLILISIILLSGFALYLNTYYKSLFNTLDPKPGNETISFYKIEEDLKDKTNYFTWLGQSTILLSIDNKNILSYQTNKNIELDTGITGAIPS